MGYRNYVGEGVGFRARSRMQEGLGSPQKHCT